MTKEEKDAAIGRMARRYNELISTRACLRHRLREHAGVLDRAAHALAHWDTSGEAENILELLDASAMDSVRQDASSMIEVEKEIATTEEDLRETGLRNLIKES